MINVEQALMRIEAKLDGLIALIELTLIDPDPDEGPELDLDGGLSGGERDQGSVL